MSCEVSFCALHLHIVFKLSGICFADTYLNIVCSDAKAFCNSVVLSSKLPLQVNISQLFHIAKEALKRHYSTTRTIRFEEQQPFVTVCANRRQNVKIRTCCCTNPCSV